jgi:hypothetical protein
MDPFTALTIANSIGGMTQGIPGEESGGLDLSGLGGFGGGLAGIFGDILEKPSVIEIADTDSKTLDSSVILVAFILLVFLTGAGLFIYRITK